MLSHTNSHMNKWRHLNLSLWWCNGNYLWNPDNANFNDLRNNIDFLRQSTDNLLCVRQLYKT